MSCYRFLACRFIFFEFCTADCFAVVVDEIAIITQCGGEKAGLNIELECAIDHRNNLLALIVDRSELIVFANDSSALLEIAC